MKIIYIVHSTSNDNEISIASGKYDVSLSTRGISQAKELHSYFSREKHNQWGSIFSSTLIRAIDTANLVFPEMQNTIIKDARLNEIDYGIYTGKNKQEVEQLLHKYFRPEFLNRIDAIIFFKRLSEEDVKKIAAIHIKALENKLKDSDIALTITPSAIKKIAELGYVKVFGARPLKRVIQQHIAVPISQYLLQEPDAKKIKITIKNDKFVLE